MHPDQLLGICHFQFADKVWKCPQSAGCTDSEGSFGVQGHSTTVLSAVQYVPADFSHTDMSAIPPFSCANNQLNVDQLTRNPVYNTVVAAYSGMQSPAPRGVSSPPGR